MSNIKSLVNMGIHRISSCVKCVFLFCILLIFGSESLIAYPGWTSWVTKTQDNFTIQFRVSNGTVDGGKLRFEGRVSSSTTQFLVGGWEVSVRENDNPLYPTRYSYGSSIGEVSGTFYSFTGFTTEACTDIGGSMGVYLQFKYSYTGIGSRDLDSPEIVISNYGDDTYEQNDSFSSASSLPQDISIGSLICTDDDWYKFVPVSPYYKYTIKIDQFYNEAGNFNLYLYNSSQTLLQSSISTSDIETINYTFTASGTYYIRVTTANGGKGFYDLSLISSCVTPPTPGSISGPNQVCSGSSNTYSILPVAGATSYTWTLPSGWSGNSVTNSITATAGSSGGTISVKANNSCTSSAASQLTVSTIAFPPQPGAISGPVTICFYTTNTYSISPVSGATSYTWTLPSGWTGSSTSTSINAYSSATGGTVSVVANNSCGSGPARTLSVTVNGVPGTPGSISGPSSVCQGGSYTYSIPAVSGASSYRWYLPTGWSGSSTSTSILAYPGSNGGQISVEASNSCGTGGTRSMSVSVSQAIGTPGGISGNTAVCQGSSQTYTVAAVTGATSYVWSLPTGWTGSSTSNSITCSIGSSGGTISVLPTGPCGTSTSSALTITVTPLPGQPGVISGPTVVCQGVPIVFSILPVSGATSYTWTLPSGWSGSSTSTSVTVTPGSSGGTICVRANNSCGSSSQVCLTITVTPLPAQPGVIAGNSTICQGSSQTYSIAAVSGATSYIWTFPSGWTGSSTSTSITLSGGASGGDITVKAVNSCGNGPIRILPIIVTPIPAQPGAITGNATVCQSSSQTYSVAPVSGATSYTWTLPSGWTGSSTTTSITTTVGSASGSVQVRANNSCGSSTNRSLPVTVGTVPAQPGTISGNSTVCSGTTHTYSISAVSGATSYTWTLPSGWTGSSTSTSITATAGSVSGSISVTANNSCGNSIARTFQVTANATPSTPTITLNGSGVLTSSASSGNQWYYAAGAISGATSETYKPVKTDDYYVKVTLNGCSSSPSSSIHVVVDAIETEYAAGKLKVYPNPASKSITVENKATINDLRYEILNSNGSIVKSSKPVLEKMTIDLESYSNGIYIIKFFNKEEVFSVRFIKQ